MCKLTNYFVDHLLGHELLMKSAIESGIIKKIIISSKSSLSAGNYDGVIVEHRNDVHLKKESKFEADVLKNKPGSLIGIKIKSGKRSRHCLKTIGYAVLN